MEEIWKNIPECNDFYQISNYGRVKSISRQIRMGKYVGLRTLPKKILKTFSYPNGYTGVMIRVNGRKYCKLLHRLIATAFIPNPENKQQVNHKNGVKNDNSIGNLEWCSRKENSDHAVNMGLIKTGKDSVSYGRTDNNKRVVCATLGIEFDSVKDAGVECGISKERVGMICRGQLIHTKGLVFRFI